MSEHLVTQQPRIDDFLAMSPAQLMDRYRIGVERFDRRVLELDDAQLDMAWLPEAGVGRWPCRVLLGHLADAEVFFVGRMRQMIAEDRPIFSVWEEEAFIDAGMYDGPKHPIGAFIATIHTLRKWIGEWLGTLKPEAFDRKAMHPIRGEQTLKMVLAYDTWHLEHHGWFLNAKVARLKRSSPG
jgi:hypothetical protein